MTTPTTPSSAGVISMLAWIIPLGGILIWVFILPSTRALLKHKAEAFSKRKEPPSPVGESASMAEEKPSTPRPRTEDPEIKRFNRDVVRTKFAHTRPERTGSE